MAYKKLTKNTYIADAKEDLKNIPEVKMGLQCDVIGEGAEYWQTSTGDWYKQGGASSSSSSGSDIDLSSYATTTYADDRAREAQNNIQIYIDSWLPDVAWKTDLNPITEALSNPVLGFFNMERNPAKHDAQAIYLNKDSGSLADAMKEKGLSFSNVWIEKGHQSLPKSMITANSSGRGIAVVDFQQDGDTIGYVILFDKYNNMYYQFLNHNTPGPWMKVGAVED